VASDVREPALDCSNLLQEERPGETLVELRAFLAE